MARRKNTDIEGQLCFDLNTNVQNYVVQANSLIVGKQSLSLNAAKIMRTLIMQIKPEDEEFKAYHIDIKELAELFGILPDNLYRDIDKITTEIMRGFVEIKEPAKERFLKVSWVNKCAYEKGKGVSISINEDMRPYLLKLKEHYTQYQLDHILRMKSVYAIRIFEMIQKEELFKYLPKDGAYIDLKVSDIRKACDCENKLLRMNKFREKVLDVACREMTDCTTYTYTYEGIKNGRNIETIRFYITR